MTIPEYTTEQVAANRVQVVEALRSGDYRQTNGTLRRVVATLTDDQHVRAEPVFGYCCLGVIEDARGCQWVDKMSHERLLSTNSGRFAPHDQLENTSTLSQVGRAWLGVTCSDPYVVVKTFRSRILTNAKGYDLTTLTALNDSRGYTLRDIGDVIADQAPDWNGAPERTENEYLRRVRAEETS